MQQGEKAMMEVISLQEYDCSWFLIPSYTKKRIFSLQVVMVHGGNILKIYGKHDAAQTAGYTKLIQETELMQTWARNITV